MPKETERGLDVEFINHVRDLAKKGETAKKEGYSKLGLELSNENDLGLEDMFDDLFLEESQNPSEAHSLYYSIQGIMKSILPIGDQFKSLRKEVYEEKNIYINRGNKRDEEGIRGSDGRMGYLHHLRVALRIVKEWGINNGNSWDLYCTFRKLNEELGYHEQKYFGDKKIENEIGEMFSNAWKYHNAAEG